MIVGLRLNAGKTKIIFFNTDVQTLHSMDGTEIKHALTDTGEQDFIYLGSWCTKDRDIRTRKALAWKSLHKLNKVWSSDMSREIKVDLFRVTTATILLYGMEAPRGPSPAKKKTPLMEHIPKCCEKF